MKLAAIQYKPPKGNVPLAHQELGALIDEAGSLGAQVIVCPEMATTGYIWDSSDDILPYAEPCDGPTYLWLKDLAIRHRAWIICGYAELTVDGIFNAAMVLSPTGERICSYRKVLLYHLDEKWASPGDKRIIIQTELGELSPIICMDINDNGCVQFLKNHSIKICAFCTNWVDEGTDVLWYWKSRLMGFKGIFIAANSWGQDRETTFSGCSMIWSSEGQVVSSLGSIGNGVVFAETH